MLVRVDRKILNAPTQKDKKKLNLRQDAKNLEKPMVTMRSGPLDFGINHLQ